MLCIHFDNENCSKCKENKEKMEQVVWKNNLWHQDRDKNYRSIQASKQAVR